MLELKSKSLIKPKLNKSLLCLLQILGTFSLFQARLIILFWIFKWDFYLC